MLVYSKCDNFEVVDYSDSEFAGCPDDMKSTSGYIFILAELNLWPAMRLLPKLFG